MQKNLNNEEARTNRPNISKEAAMALLDGITNNIRAMEVVEASPSTEQPLTRETWRGFRFAVMPTLRWIQDEFQKDTCERNLASDETVCGRIEGIRSKLHLRN